MMDLKEKVKRITKEILDEILFIRRHLHQNPELSFQEFKTSEFIQNQLKAENIPFKSGYAKTGILGWIEGKNPDSRTIALRADMDALPIQEENNLDFKSINNGVMHACGHDVHMSVLLGTAKVLNKLKEEFEGRILLIFQPGEEMLPGGSLKMMEDGVFEKYNPELILGLHVLPEMETGKLGFKEGIYMASGDEIYLNIKGKGGHGALPEMLNDTVLAASSILVNLQQVVSRNANPKMPTVLSFGKFIAEGATNIIPSIVNIAGTFRTFDESWRKQAHQLITEIAENTAKSFGTICEVEIRNGYPTLYNNPSVTKLVRNSAVEMIGEENVEDMEIRMTTEDFGWFSQKYPVCFYRLGVKSQESDGKLHTNKLIVNESSLEIGVNVMAFSALNAINTIE